MDNRINVLSTSVELQLKVPGRTFEEKKEFCMGLLYVSMFFFIVFSVGMMLFAPLKHQFSCVYKVNSYDCEVASQSLLRDLGANNFSNIRSAVVGSGHDSEETKYQIQLLTSQNTQVSFSNVWTNMYSNVQKRVNALNKMFNMKKSFTYNLGLDIIFLILIIVFFIAPFILFFVFKYFFNNYVFVEVGNGRYKAILKGKDLGKLPSETVYALARETLGEENIPVEFKNNIGNNFIDNDMTNGINGPHKDFINSLKRSIILFSRIVFAMSVLLVYMIVLLFLIVKFHLLNFKYPIFGVCGVYAILLIVVIIFRTWKYESNLQNRVNGLRDAENKAFKKEMFEQGKEGFADSTWNKNDQAFRERDIEDATKQFYDDGK